MPTRRRSASGKSARGQKRLLAIARTLARSPLHETRALPPGVPGVGRPAHRAALVDAELRRLSSRIEADFFTVCELVQEAIDGAYYARYGFADAERYLEDRLGLSYRSVRRRLSVLEAVRTLPAKDQDEAKTQLAALGSHKAAILAPALRQDGAGWRDWIKTAATAAVADVQARVSRAIGSKRRGAPPGSPGSRWLTHTLNLIEDPEKRAEVEEAFRLGYQIGQTDNAFRVLFAMVEECIQEWRLRVQAGVE